MKIQNVKHISEAIYNTVKEIAGYATATDKAEFKRKSEICADCEFRKGFRCGACGCVLTLKIKSSSKCPKSKW